MADFVTIPELARLAPILAGAFRGFVQSRDPYEKYYDEYGDPYAMPESEPLPIGAIIVGCLIGIGINVLFGFWGKSRAEKYDVNPWIGFVVGFVFGFIGVMIVPVFRAHRVIVQPQGRYMAAPHAPNPMYAPQVQAFNPTPGYGMPPPPPPMPPAPPPPPQMLIADPSGYVDCPQCGSRTKSGRKTCMTCGGILPPVYNPHLR